MSKQVVLLVLLVLCGVIVLAMGMMGVVIGAKGLSDREKYSAYECGFDGKGEGRFYFSLRFFLVTIMFLMFDVEVVLLLPLPVLLGGVSVFSWGVGGFVFLLFLLIGLYYEWGEGTLEWS